MSMKKSNFCPTALQRACRFLRLLAIIPAAAVLAAPVVLMAQPQAGAPQGRAPQGEYNFGPRQENFVPYEIAVLQALDKVTGRVQRLEAPLGASVHYGEMTILARTCQKAPPEDNPEAAAFLEIWQKRPSEQQGHWLFQGWMFASSPALSAMDNPVYDVWLLDCKNFDMIKDSDPSAN